MSLALQIKLGPLAGKTISVASRQSVLIGRAAERAQFAVPHDNQMSGVHFAVECGPNGCRVIDKKSTNGTFLNGARIQEAMLLANGDEIKSGQTIFVVHIVPDHQPVAPSANSAVVGPSSIAVAPRSQAEASQSPGQRPVAATPKPPAPVPPPSPNVSKPPAFAIGSWAFQKIPERWQIQEGLGIQQIVKDAFPASIGVTEEPLGPGITLPEYVEAHTKMFREHLPEPKIDLAASPAIPGSEETAALEIRFTIKDGPSVYFRRVYVRSGSTIGVLTLTALEKDLQAIRPLYDSTLSAVSFSRQE
jgi:pSer/pThr/pTyr-binding forkhead associated (FHA) protein